MKIYIHVNNNNIILAEPCYEADPQSVGRYDSKVSTGLEFVNVRNETKKPPREGYKVLYPNDTESWLEKFMFEKCYNETTLEKLPTIINRVLTPQEDKMLSVLIDDRLAGITPFVETKPPEFPTPEEEIKADTLAEFEKMPSMKAKKTKAKKDN